MKHLPYLLPIAIILLGMFLGTFTANAGFFDWLFPQPQSITLRAATSTNVKYLFLDPSQTGGGNLCLERTSTGLVVTSTAACGTGGGASATTTWDIFGTILSPTSTATVVDFVQAIASATQARFASTTIQQLTFTTLFGTVDISANTNLTAGDALTVTDDDIDFDGGASPSGDLGGTWASPSVNDDSHNHNATTISGLGVADFVSALISQWTNDAGYGSSTGANPTATADTTAVNGSASTFMRSDGAPKIHDKFASSSITFNIYDATTTDPYGFFKWRTEVARTITEISCDEYAAATSTFEIYRASGLGSEANAAMILGSISCGVSGTTSNTFVNNTLTAGSFLFINATGTFEGTPTWTALNIYFKK